MFAFVHRTGRDAEKRKTNLKIITYKGSKAGENLDINFHSVELQYVGVVLFVNCLKTNLNLCIKTEPVPVTTVYVWFYDQIQFTKSQAYCIYRCAASAQSVKGSVFMQRYRVFLGQCMV